MTYNYTIAADQIRQIEEWARADCAPRFPSMTYEEGILVMIALLVGDITSDEICED